MSNAPDDFLVQLNGPTQTEGKTAWEQIVDVAITKASAYLEGAANILVVESDSECLDLMVDSAVHEYECLNPMICGGAGLMASCW